MTGILIRLSVTVIKSTTSFSIKSCVIVSRTTTLSISVFSSTGGAP